MTPLDPEVTMTHLDNKLHRSHASNSLQRKSSFKTAQLHYRKTYGKFKTPPMCSDYIEYRRKLNNLEHFSYIVHPYFNEAHEWSLSDNMFQVVPDVRSELVYVDCKKKVSDMICYLMSQKEISIDCEFDNDNFYHITTSLVQISSHTKDFVIDPFITYSELKSGLKSIFRNPDIVKVVFSENDIRAFQRDFELFMVGVVDVQSVFQTLNGYPQRKDYGFVVQNLLEVQLDKSLQFFPWSLRPLPKDAIEYARNDTKYLIRCWNKIKALYDVEDIDLSVSKTQTVSLYSFPRRKNYLSDFEFAVTQIILMKNLDVNILKDSPDLFETAWKWREFVAKNTDINPKIISAIELGKIIILSPKDVKSVKVISHPISQIDDIYLVQLLGLLNPREGNPLDGPHDREANAQAIPHEMDWADEVRKEDSSNKNVHSDDMLDIMVDDSTVEFVNRTENNDVNDISNIVQHLYITNPKTGVKRIRLSQEDKVVRNRKYREKMKAKIRKEKAESKALGEESTRRKRNRGKKWKTRGKDRRAKGFPMGPSSVP
jgi:ribonuclease D